MLGWRLLRDAELALQRQLTDAKIASLEAELKAAKEYAAKCERLIEHERERIDSERERADRIADSLFQSNGLPATSTTVIAEQKKAEEELAGKRKSYLDELAEMYGDMEHELTPIGEDEVVPEEPEAVKA
jgi:hypothetical protein